MNIVIENSGYGLDNLGDIAMLQVACKRLESLFPGSNLHVVTTASDRLNKFVPNAKSLSVSTRDKWLETFNITGGWHHFIPNSKKNWLIHTERRFKTRYPVLARRRLAMRFGKQSSDYLAACDFVDLIKDSDLVIGTGGGYINDVFNVHAKIVLDVLGLAQSLGVPTALVGQGLGPVSDRYLKKAVRNTFDNLVLLSLREGMFSPALSTEIGGVGEGRWVVTGDDAIEFGLASTACARSDLLGVNIRLASYAGVSASQSAALGDLIVDTAKKFGAKIKILPVDISGSGADRQATMGMLGFGQDSDFFIPDDESVESLVSAAGSCRVVITGSYHAAVFSLCKGVPVIAIVASKYYMYKFSGLAHQFPGGMRIIDLSDQNWALQLSEAVSVAWEVSNSLRDSLVSLAEEQLNVGQQAYLRLRESC